MAGIESLRSHLTKDLSGGWKQRLALGCAIIHEPKIIFLDEPTSGVDPIARQDFWNLIKDMAKKGVTVFVTTHYMDEAENCNRMALVYRGTIIALGTSKELKNTFMKDNVLHIEVDAAEEWIEKLMKLPAIKETALFGNAIHAIAEDEKKAIADVKNLFEKENVKKYKLEKIEPSLEDVFVSLIEAYDKTKDTRESKKS
jgi:ABC-2 type transport system ATP-binding protein